MHDDGAKLSFREKAGYGIGDAAANFIFQTMLVFQLAFYTDTFGITAGAAGTLFLVVRFWDAIFDPMMGVIADRTKTKWGQVQTLGALDRRCRSGSSRFLRSRHRPLDRKASSSTPTSPTSR
jgi:hypothetical protein